MFKFPANPRAKQLFSKQTKVKKMSKLKFFLATSSSFAAGFCVQRFIQNPKSGFESMPGFPKFATVSAATAAVLSPSTSQLTIPEVNKDVIPPEPQKGISRVAEIMRFGFPGFDNIRSRK